jgi:glyoxylate reductase
MEKPRVLITRRLALAPRRVLGAGIEVDQHDEETLMERAPLLRRVHEVSALLCGPGDRIDKEVLEAAPRLRIVANHAVGYDNVDVPACTARGVWVTNTPDVLTDATADLTWSLILAVARRVVEGDRLVRSGRFSGWKPDLLLGVGLQGKTLGIVGMGRIGRAVARRAVGFGMAVCYQTAEVDSPVGAAEAERVQTLEELLSRSNVLSLHCPLTPETRHLLDRRRLRLLPRGAVVVNTSRGEVVDEEALAEALESGHLAGVGLDVYEREPEVHPALLRRSDVVLLPHLGSATAEARQAMADLAVDNVLAVLDGQPPLTPVNRPGAPRP